ncbi:MAG: peptidoglycan-binding protein [Chthoniobacterales bacterium]
MKKFITIWIGCSLALAAGALAQQDEAQPTPKKKGQEKARAAEQGKPTAEPRAVRPAPKQHAVKTVRAPFAATPDAKAPAGQHTKDRNASKTPATANKPAIPARTEATAQTEAQAPTTPQASKLNPGAHRVAAETKKPDIQAIKAQHANFHAQPKPQQVPAVTFNQNRRINGSERWQGENYVAFRSYHPQMHDQAWYRSRYSRVELIGGGYYYWNAGYWYPAWGYNPSVSYYVYDGPIYVGSRAEPPDRVIADVQAALQDQGYYQGEVDGLLGPLTRQALTAYQTDNGLYTTAAIDEPTLASLGLD